MPWHNELMVTCRVEPLAIDRIGRRLASVNKVLRSIALATGVCPTLVAKIVICKRFSLFLALFWLWYCKITSSSHCYDRLNAILTVLHMYMFFFDIVTENIFNVLFCSTKNPKI